MSMMWNICRTQTFLSPAFLNVHCLVVTEISQAVRKNNWTWRLLSCSYSSLNHLEIIWSRSCTVVIEYKLEQYTVILYNINKQLLTNQILNCWWQNADLSNVTVSLRNFCSGFFLSHSIRRDILSNILRHLDDFWTQSRCSCCALVEHVGVKMCWLTTG